MHPAFTLLELLVVIGIISVLLVAVIPAVNTLSKSNGRKAAIGNLLGALEQARAEAIKSGRATYVVFPSFATGTSQATRDRYHYKAFAIFQDDRANAATPKQLTTWKILPTGISLRADAASGQSLANLTEAANLNPAEAFSFTPDPSASLTFYCIKYNEEGEIESPAPAIGSIQLAVFEGHVDNTNEVLTTRNVVSETITIPRLSGRAQHNS